MRNHRQKQEGQPLGKEVQRVLHTFPSRPEGLARHRGLYSLAGLYIVSASVKMSGSSEHPSFLPEAYLAPSDDLPPVPCWAGPQLYPAGHYCLLFQTPCSSTFSCAHLRNNQKAGCLAGCGLGRQASLSLLQWGLISTPGNCQVGSVTRRERQLSQASSLFPSTPQTLTLPPWNGWARDHDQTNPSLGHSQPPMVVSPGRA